MTADTFTRLRDVILDGTGGGPVLIEPDSRIAEAIPDSLDRFEVILGAEEEFGIEISDAEAEALIDSKRGAA